VSLGYDVVEPGLEHTGQLAEAAIAIGFNILRALCGPQWQPHDVQFSFAAPRDLAPFRKFFGLTPRFDQERSAIAFPARWLANAPPGAAPILHRMMKDRIEELLAGDADDVVGRVRRFLRATVTTSRSSVEDAASTLRISTRTLKRRQAIGLKRSRVTGRASGGCASFGPTQVRARSRSSTITERVWRWDGLSTECAPCIRAKCCVKSIWCR
jgi:ribosomal protein L28